MRRSRRCWHCSWRWMRGLRAGKGKPRFVPDMIFTTPLILLALLALPVLWWLLRATPPAPRAQNFPAIRLLVDLHPREETPARTPWWLLALRLSAAALIILGLAGPLLGGG